MHVAKLKKHQEINRMKRLIKFSLALFVFTWLVSASTFPDKYSSFSDQKAKITSDTTGMVFVQGSEFKMGSYQFSNERPVHEVVLDDFYIGKYEVTVKEYQKYCEETGAQMPPPPSWGFKPNHPIVNVTFGEARKYAEWAGKRLPTEAEWEYAAKGGNQGNNYRYAGANLAGAVGWSFENSLNTPQPVGLRRPNELGIYDMSGNVWEWCADYFGRYTADRIKNPKGPETGINRVLRGGSWFDKASNLRVANRFYAGEAHKDVLTGFRLAMDAPKAPAKEEE